MTQPRRNRAAAVAVAAITLGAASPGTLAQGSAPAGCTGPTSQTWLNVVINGVRSSDGLVAVTLYADNSRKFLVKRGSMYVGRVNATAGTMRACIFVPQPGVYALAIYHDANANQSFDRTGIGLPAEGYGFTNNPATLAGLPSFRSVRLDVPRTGLTTRIQMKYP